MKLSKPVCFLTIIYSLLVLMLGIMGYLAGSTVSLLVGGSFGVLLLIASITMFMEKKVGMFFALAFSLIVGLSFAFRFAKTSAFMPGAMALFSAIVVVSLASEIYRTSPKKR